MRRKTQYYRDPLHDDFAANSIHTKPVEEDFPFIHKELLWRLGAFLVYYGVAVPLVWLCARLYLGVRFENRRQLRSLRKTGYFLYGNHTRDLDGILPSLAAFPKKAYVIANPNAVSIPLLKNLVQMLGTIPVPTQRRALPGFLQAVQYRCKKKCCVAIYPEAHIWPFYTGVRPFEDTSFRYPVQQGVPAVAMAATYRVRGGLLRPLNLPGMTLHISPPFYPDATLSPVKARKDLRDRVYAYLRQQTDAQDNVEFVHYEPWADEDPVLQRENDDGFFKR